MYIRSLPIGQMNHVVLLAALIISFFQAILTGTYITLQALRMTGRDRMLADLKARLKWLPIRLEESMMVLGVASWSLFLIARVLKGQCPAGTSLWEQQTCNPFASQGGIPNELAYSLYFAPLALQLVTRNLSIRTLVITHMTTLAVVAFCVCYSKAWSDYAVLLNWLMSSNISFEIKRLQRISFKDSSNAKDLQELAVRRSSEVDLLKQEQERSRYDNIILLS